MTDNQKSNSPNSPQLPVLSLVVAVAENGVIGNAGDLPWRMSGDLKRFKQLTMGHAMVMGRKTYDSIGRPLPGRVTIVLSKQRDYDPQHDEVRVAHSLEEALQQLAQTEMQQDQLFVVGGAEIYRLALPHAGRIYRTVVHATPEGDTRFAELDAHEWRVVEQTEYAADEKNEFACTWEVLERME